MDIYYGIISAFMLNFLVNLRLNCLVPLLRVDKESISDFFPLMWLLDSHDLWVLRERRMTFLSLLVDPQSSPSTCVLEMQ